MSNKYNEGRAWSPTDGIAWFSDVPTMLVGIHISHGIGQSAMSVIGASIALDPYTMNLGQDFKIQTKNIIISSEVMIDIFKTLY